jgi:branched-chain amino acid transport system permease protein
MKHPLLWFAPFALALAILPAVGNNYLLQQATFVCMYCALALSWNIIGGYAGYPSFATAAFVGLGSYAGALLQNAGLPMVAAWVGATLVTGLFAALLGWGLLRMKGHYFAVGSISIVELLRLASSSWSGLTGGGEGLNLPILPGGPEFAGRVFFYAMLAVMLLAFVMTLLVQRSRLGFGLQCIQQNEDAADMVGVDVVRYKTIAFTLSALFCGTVGAISASWVAYIAPTDAFSILMTLKVPVMVLLGGPGTVLGPVIGATCFVLIEQTVWTRFLDYNQAALGLVVVLLIFFLPNGLLGRLQRVRAATIPVPQGAPTPVRRHARQQAGSAAARVPERSPLQGGQP